MWFRCVAALAVMCAVPCVPARAQSSPASASPLSLDEAFTRVASTHPDLRLFGARHDVLLAEREQAALRPAWTAGAELENVLGSGQARGLERAELTISLASVFERGGKLDARKALAQARIDAGAIARESRRLDLLAETARRYLAVVAANEQRTLAAVDIAQRKRTVSAARKRLDAGASPESVVLTAQAALARAELALARSEHQFVAARQHLAALWGERAPSFAIASSRVPELPRIAELPALSAWLERTPELQQFASEQRVREARLQLARSEARADIDWSIGVRGFQEGDDVGLVAAVSMPLGASARARPAIRVAEAELASLGIERESLDIALYSTLVEAHGRYRIAQQEVVRLRDDMVPRLAKAEAAAERAYLAGAISYLEWAQLQSETTAARKQQLDAALDAHGALIELQRLTGTSLLDGGPASISGGTEP